jgi:phage-related protein
MKPLKFVGSSLRDLSAFPDGVRRRAGYELWQVQLGLTPSDFKPMSTIGSGCYEIRIHERGEFRVIYVAKFKGAIYVLHAFQKKTRSTTELDLALAKQRLRQVEDRR